MQRGQGRQGFLQEKYSLLLAYFAIAKASLKQGKIFLQKP
jgi:hypothetical protein